MTSPTPKFNPLSNTDVDTLGNQIELATSGGSSLEHQSAPFFSRKLGFAVGRDNPVPGLTTAATFGLSHEDWTDVGFKDRTELVTTWKGDEPTFTNVLVSVARACVINRIPPFAGVVFGDAFAASNVPNFGKRMPHGLGLFPYMWKDARFGPVQLSAHRVWFVQVVPIFEGERTFLAEHGIDAFETILAGEGARFYLSSRDSHC